MGLFQRGVRCVRNFAFHAVTNILLITQFIDLKIVDYDVFSFKCKRYAGFPRVWWSVKSVVNLFIIVV